jgi:WD40-like Beta Propeller Repeat
VLLLGVASALTFACTAGSATSTRYVLWSTRTAGVPAIPVRVLPADLPDDTQHGASADLLDRTAAGRLAVASLTDVVVENADGSGRTVVPVGGVYDGRFSPDGSMLVLASRTCAYSDSRCENISVVDSDGGNLHLLANHAGAARWIGGLLVYVGAVAADGVGTLEVADPSGRTARVLGRSFAFPALAPAPSPDGRLVVDQCRAQQICVRETRVPRRVVARFRGAAEAAVWSPDGRRIALTLAGNYTTTTAVGTVTTGVLDRISSPPYVGTDDTVLAWSPDGGTVLVQRRCNGGPCRDQVFSESVSTHARRRLTSDDRQWESARWTKTSLTYVTPPG